MKGSVTKILSLLSLCFFVSCSIEVLEEQTCEDCAIDFASVATRAAIDGSFPSGTSFSVWGWYTGTKVTNQVFDRTEITNNSGNWEYTDTQFWVLNCPYDFYAVHPHDGITASVASDGTISVTNFDCSKIGSEAIDLMTAQKNGITYTGDTPPSPVDLKFGHELAKLNFVVKSENAVATITEFKVYGVDYIGTLSKKSTTATWTDKTTCQDTDTPFSINQEFVFNTTEGWEKNVFGDILLIPDNDLTDAFLKIQYKYSDETTERTSVVGLKTALTDKWEAGKNYKYSLTIEGGSLTINVTVIDWTEKDTSVSWG